jgi:hypothetical protein
MNPVEYHVYGYVSGNPVRFVDPWGYVTINSPLSAADYSALKESRYQISKSIEGLADWFLDYKDGETWKSKGIKTYSLQTGFRSEEFAQLHNLAQDSINQMYWEADMLIPGVSKLALAWANSYFNPVQWTANAIKDTNWERELYLVWILVEMDRTERVLEIIDDIFNQHEKLEENIDKNCE